MHESNLSPCGRCDLIVPSRIVFGSGERTRVGALASELASTAIVIDGRNDGAHTLWSLDDVRSLLAASGVEVVAFERITREPRVADVDAITSRYRAASEESPRPSLVVIGLGGGSAIDVAKAVAAMLPQTRTAPPSVKAFLEGVGTGATLQAAPFPVLAMPTTAGTGAEATRNAVLSSSPSDATPFKKSLRDDRLMPRVVLIDPELTLSCPREVTASSGLDALTQLIESCVTRRSQVATRLLATRGCALAVRALTQLVDHPSDLAAREAMAEAAFLSGICLTNAGLGMAHGVAPALGMHAGVAHGVACAMLLATSIRTNASVAAHDYATLAHALAGTSGVDSPHTVFPTDTEAVAFLIETVETLTARWQILPRLRDVGVTRDQIPAIVADSFGSSMKGNPRELTPDTLTPLLEKNW